MPDDLTNQVSKALNRRSITTEQELQDALNEMARDIALIEPDPQDWGWWMSYLLDRLKSESKRNGKGKEFREIKTILKSPSEY